MTWPEFEWIFFFWFYVMHRTTARLADCQNHIDFINAVKEHWHTSFCCVLSKSDLWHQKYYVWQMNKYVERTNQSWDIIQYWLHKWNKNKQIFLDKRAQNRCGASGFHRKTIELHVIPSVKQILSLKFFGPLYRAYWNDWPWDPFEAVAVALFLLCIVSCLSVRRHTSHGYEASVVL